MEMMHGRVSEQKGSPNTTRVREGQKISKGGGARPQGRKEKNCAMSQNRALAGVGKATRKKYGGHSREADKMEVWCRRIIIRGRSFIPYMSMVRILEETMEEH